jgi:hypothetical protein
LEARLAWEDSEVRKEMLCKRRVMLEDEADITLFGEHFEIEDLEEGHYGSNNWEVFAKGLSKSQQSHNMPQHGPPCKYRLFCIVMLSAIVTAEVLTYTVVPLYRDPLMHAVGKDWFTPLFTICMISGVMPLVFLVWVPLITTFVVPHWVSVRPAQGSCGHSRLSRCCFWFCVG